jgi:hypothetical protein
MDILWGSFLGLLMYGIPAILGGLPIFAVIVVVAWVIGRIKAPVDSKRRKRILRNGIIVGVVVGLVLGIYVCLAAMIFYDKSKSVKTPEDIIFSQYFTETRRDGRDSFWGIGTIASLAQWIDQNGKEFKNALRKNLHSGVESKIEAELHFKPVFAVDSNDLATLEQLALEFNATENSESPRLLPNYLTLKKNGLRDFPAALATTNTSFDTYLLMSIKLCTQEPQLAECLQYMTVENIATLELRHDDADEYTKEDWEYKLNDLRLSKGIKERINSCREEWCMDRYKEHLCRKTKNPDPELNCP